MEIALRSPTYRQIDKQKKDQLNQILQSEIERLIHQKNTGKNRKDIRILKDKESPDMIKT